MATQLTPGGERRWVGWALLTLGVALDWTVFRGLTLFGQSPDPVLAAALVAAALGQERAAGMVGVLGGLLADLPGGLLVGIGGVSRGLAASGAARLVARLGTEPYVLLVGLVMLASSAEWAISLVGAWAFGVRVSLSLHTLAGAASRILLTAALFSTLYPLGAWWYRPSFHGRVQQPQGL